MGLLFCTYIFLWSRGNTGVGKKMGTYGARLKAMGDGIGLSTSLDLMAFWGIVGTLSTA
jgi:hypothetical protein